MSGVLHVAASGRRRAIEFVRSSIGSTLSSGVTTVTVTTSPGDFVIAVGATYDVASDPTLPADWTKLLGFGISSPAVRRVCVAYKFASSTSESCVFTGNGSSGAFNASGAAVFRNVSAVGATATNAAGTTSTTIPIPSLTLTATSASSALFVCSYLPQILSGTGSLLDTASGQAYRLGVPSWSSGQTVSTANSIYHIAAVVELLN